MKFLAFLLLLSISCGSASTAGDMGSDAGEEAGIPDGAPDTTGPDAATCTDLDNDGIDTCAAEPDCNDNDSLIYPGAPELCNGVSDDCDAELDEDCICPLLTYSCAAGCCAVTSEVVSQARADSAAIVIDGQGNIYVSYALTSSGTWSTETAAFERATSTWTHDVVLQGGQNTALHASATGRLHHLYTGSSSNAPVHYRYSDDQAASWVDVPVNTSIPSGGGCTLDVDHLDSPHLFCANNNNNDPRQRYLSLDGTTWNIELADVEVSGYDETILQMGFADRPHLLATYGPTDAHLHYSFHTGTQWLIEAVPIEVGHERHPDYDPDFVLADNDEPHIAYLEQDDNGDFSARYATRNTAGEWTIETAIPSAELGGVGFGSAYLALDSSGQPVVFTSHGSGARRSTNGSWTRVQTGYPIEDIALQGDYAYIVFDVEGLTYEDSRLHISLVDMSHD